MRAGRVFYLLGRVIVVVGAAMLLPLVCALFYREPDAYAFGLAMLLTCSCGLLLGWLCRSHRQEVMRKRDGFLFVTLAWVLASFFAGLPFLFAGSFDNMASAFFEAMSGLTTTGASAMADVEIMPHCILLWRALTHWLGGAGIVLLFIALIQPGSNTGEGAVILKSEYSGNVLAERVAARSEENAAAVFRVYLVLTAACILALRLTGMDLFDTVCHALATVSTGGFSTKNLSVGHFNNPAAEWVIAVFLFLSSLNMALYYLFFVRRRFRKVLRDNELCLFTIITVVATVLITVSLRQNFYQQEGWLYSLRLAFFQVASIISTGGFATADFDQWPDLARLLLLALLFVGGCAGSTAGGIKVNRFHIAFAGAGAQLRSVIRPHSVHKVHYNGHAVNQDALYAVGVFIFLYLMLAAAGCLLLTMMGLDWLEAFVAALTALSNVGPGIGSMGPVGNYAAVPALGKYLLSFLMLAGRLELYTVLALFLPSFWRR